MAGAKKIRLDELVLQRGFAASRSEAKALIMTGKVMSGTERLDKAGVKVSVDTDLKVEAGRRFVGRGGEKLQGFVDQFGLSFAGLAVLDVGACTGGFTDCALQLGASEATCVDVGRGQLHSRLTQDDRVTNLERVNARYLDEVDLPRETYPRIVMDLSFISLRSVLPSVWKRLEAGGILVALVKPQFEVGKAIADRYKGVIKDESARKDALASVLEFAISHLEGAELVGKMESPITGTDGNVEYLIGLSRSRA